MNNKKWLTAILIVTVLVIAFFWGGDYQKNPVKVAESSTGSPSINETVPSQTATNSDEGTTEIGTKDSPEIGSSQETVEPQQTKEAQEPQEAKETEAAKESAPTNTPAETGKAPDKIDKSPEASKPPQTKPEIKEPSPEPKKDKYLTDPVPAGKPKPVEWQDVKVDKKEKLTVTLSVTCKTILDNLNIFNKDKLEVLPEDGVIYKARKVTFYKGESVFDVLLREMKSNKIHMEFEMTPIYNSNYIEGINNIYEFDCGELSGWMFKVNGWFPNYGSSRYILEDGDVVDWVYTCDLGRDIGGDATAGGDKK
ncbi:DUF4430 domain-containing protein [Cohnella abietis]|uniref:Transcobalamin-like C-terminal domain-containing protein n=1 Tax=Cohnella abietis TaxID=2507935 RepID=A0A3T1DBM9_9BACL|nr:DUF4430 domain-containing protein [Cohnella abietis]BBI35464.1 hypothetical protein KCTCHS21_48630 [Cohnella abietis]